MTPAFKPLPSLIPSEPNLLELPLISALAACALLSAGCGHNLDPGTADESLSNAGQEATQEADPDEQEGQDEEEAGTDGEDGTEQGEDEEDAEDQEQPLFAPTEGGWVITEATRTKDGCGLDQFTERGEAGSEMSLIATGDGAFDLIFNGGSETVNCEIDENLRYLCTAETSEDHTPSEYGLNATILVDLTSHGEFFTATEMSLISVVDLDCTGPQCGMVAFLLGTSFPCRMVTDSLSIPN